MSATFSGRSVRWVSAAAMMLGDRVCAWTRADLCRWLEERFAKTYHPSSMTRVLRRMGFSRQKARPGHPRKDAEAQERFKKRGLATS